MIISRIEYDICDPLHDQNFAQKLETINGLAFVPTFSAMCLLEFYNEFEAASFSKNLHIAGQLSTLLLRLKEDRGRTVVPISDNFVRRLQFLADRLDFVTTRGAAVVQKTEPDYYESQSF